LAKKVDIEKHLDGSIKYNGENLRYSKIEARPKEKI